MLFILRWLKRWLYRPVAIPPRVARSPVEPPPPVAAPATPVTEPEVQQQFIGDLPIHPVATSNRHERRKLEKARRKYDKFVTPQGATPEKPKRETQEIKPKPPKVEVITEVVEIEDTELLIADTHHENRNDTVLYKEAEMYGEFNFRDTILQQLERYFYYLDRMRKHDPDAYGLYREIGATILPYVATSSSHRLPDKDDYVKPKDNTPLADYFHQTRPTFGCFTYGADPETERYERETKSKKSKHTLWVPKFMYFRKYAKPPPELQMISGGDIYAMTIWWDRDHDGKKHYKWGHPQEFGIFVSRDGKQVVALRSCATTYIPLRHKKNGARHRRGEMFTIPQHAWHIPGDFEKWARENGDDVQHFLTEIFKQAVLRTEHSQYSMTRITATKDDVTAVFSVNIHRTSYFFQDRDIHVNEHGARKRIFHFVRPHVRSDGTQVKAHFRGEREFTWAGYAIKITIPGRDHFDPAEFNYGAVDEYWWQDEPRDDMLDMPALGKKLKQWMNEGRGKHT